MVTIYFLSPLQGAPKWQARDAELTAAFIYGRSLKKIVLANILIWVIFRGEKKKKKEENDLVKVLEKME